MTFDPALFRVHDEAGADGYPLAWLEVKRLVREVAGYRCERCGHPYPPGIAKEHPGGVWTPCDERCSHGMPARCEAHPFESLAAGTTTGALLRDAAQQGYERVIEAQYRILTTHHLNGDKRDLRWWNLAALCQRCHLTIQGRVVMDRAFILEHSGWFKPHAAGWYAAKYEGRDITVDEALERQDELLALERVL